MCGLETTGGPLISVHRRGTQKRPATDAPRPRRQPAHRPFRQPQKGSCTPPGTTAAKNRRTTDQHPAHKGGSSKGPWPTSQGPAADTVVEPRRFASTSHRQRPNETKSCESYALWRTLLEFILTFGKPPRSGHHCPAIVWSATWRLGPRIGTRLKRSAMRTKCPTPFHSSRHPVYRPVPLLTIFSSPVARGVPGNRTPISLN